ncbi:hypothetical protein COLO4_20241 [Corchorus olitorius]|uniref:Uncharacterized protein n=1 Tax=Corchorus olitorius TaxID=93759 RepID=A0A1R3J105_9ROSI|nr:hypothetical protein COLO4_20241 [Corchorus olitorius]
MRWLDGLWSAAREVVYVSPQVSGSLEAYIPARKVPDWFDYKQVGSAVLFCMPSISTGQYRAVIVFVIYSVDEEYDDHQESTRASLTLYFKNKTKGSGTFDRTNSNFFDGDICQDHAWVSYITPDIFLRDMNADEGDEIEVSIEPRGGILVKACGIHLPIHRQ